MVTSGFLSEADAAADPMTQFSAWYADVAGSGMAQPEAMVLATASAQGRPSARTVLLKGHDHGFVFYTNYGSRKGADVAENPQASLVFPWYAMQRQVSVVGRVEWLDPFESAAYFHSRPYGSQLGAWASEQSAVIPSREHLEERFAQYAARWPQGTEVPAPAFWGGLRVVPDDVEFWQGRQNRLHDRLRYRRGDAGWVVERLAP